jgi:type II secretory ATPase GspE/PulE/Tfp pilus assembly ATPase PilB-like protein
MATAASNTPFKSRMMEVVNKIHAAPTSKDIIVGLRSDIQALFNAERMTIFALDTKNQQLYSISEVGSELKEIRVPKNFSSIAGFTGLSRKVLNIKDAYDDAELKALHPQLHFDKSWDKKSNFKTTQVLSVPITFEKYLLGVMQLVNRTGGTGGFTKEEAAGLMEVAKTVGIAFYNQRKNAGSGKNTRYSGLVAKGAVSEDDVKGAASEARVRNCSIEQVLLDKFEVPKADLLQSLSQFTGVPSFNFTGAEEVPEDLMDRVPVEFLRKHNWVPVARQGREVLVAMDDPQDLTKIDAIQTTNLAPKIEFLVATREDIQGLIDASFGEAEEEDPFDDFDDDDLVLVDDDDPDEDGGPDEQDSHVVRLANQIIRDAYRSGVSDIHIEPYGDKDATVVRFRTDGECKIYKEVAPEFRQALVSRFKIMAHIDISEKRKPQDGKIRFQGKKKSIELRVATLPTAGGNEDIVMRILAGSEPLPLDGMGFSERNLVETKKILAQPYGLFLVVGPTGSGKTTTLHSALGFINTAERKIWTAEDPVEITQKGLRQVQVHAKIGLTFAAAMRAFLRADPDVIMVGEMRDHETTHTGIEASLTGHLVFSTLHTNSAAETITRLLDMGIDPFSFSDALLGILAQRLMRTLCKDCKEPINLTKESFDELVDAYGRELFPRTGLKPSADTVLYAPKGCKKCADSGNRGRMAVHELLVCSDEIKELVSNRAAVTEIHDLGVSQGMETLLQDGVLKVLGGHTTLKQVRTVCMK